MFPGVSSHFPDLRKLEITVGHNVGQFVHANPVVGELMLINATIYTTFRASPHMRAMTLSGLTLFPRFSVWSDWAVAALWSLTSLELNFGYPSDPAILRQIRSWTWDKTFPGPSSMRPLPERAHIFSQWRLYHLVLSASKEEPAYHAFERMHEVSFPNLIKLRIKNMVFRHPDPPLPPTAPGALEAFVTRHPNLRTLVLDDCMLQKDDAGGVYRHWAALCRSLSQALTCLIHLSVHRHDMHAAAGTHDGAGALECPCWEFPIGYASAPRGVFERSVFYDPATALRDMEALLALEKAIWDRVEALYSRKT